MVFKRTPANSVNCICDGWGRKCVRMQSSVNLWKPFNGSVVNLSYLRYAGSIIIITFSFISWNDRTCHEVVRQVWYFIGNGIRAIVWMKSYWGVGDDIFEWFHFQWRQSWESLSRILRGLLHHFHSRNIFRARNFSYTVFGRENAFRPYFVDHFNYHTIAVAFANEHFHALKNVRNSCKRALAEYNTRRVCQFLTYGIYIHGRYNGRQMAIIKQRNELRFIVREKNSLIRHPKKLYGAIPVGTLAMYIV